MHFFLRIFSHLFFCDLVVFMRFTLKLLILFLPFLMFGCNDKPSKKHTELVMGTTADNPPFEFIENGTHKGMDIEIAKEIAKQLGDYKLQIKDMPFFALLPALTGNKVHFVMAGFSITDERSKVMDFSIPYFTPSYALVYKTSVPIVNELAMQDKKIGVLLGTTMEGMLKKIRDKGVRIHIVTVDKNQALTKGLLNGAFDGIMMEEVQAKGFIQNVLNMHTVPLAYADFKDHDGSYAVALPKNSPLLSKINVILEEMQESGQLDTIKKKWLG